MSQTIPGGRPRASSDGDILDESLCGTLFVNLSERRSEENSRKNPTTNPSKTLSNVIVNNNNTCDSLDSSNDAFDSDGELSSHSQFNSARSRKKSIFFKSMRKVVSRAFVKDSTVKRIDKSNNKAGDVTKVWTPDLRHFVDKTNAKSNGNDPSDSGTMSIARPLITDFNLGPVVPKWKKTPGTVGIFNHGNSCFMNCVLQCLSSTDSFTEYFIRDFFKNDLKNSSNGKKGVFRSNFGEVTEQLGHLLKCLWSGKYSCEVSKEFKAVVGKFNSQYKGDHQHDAQEFLLWLLDRIHEDVSTNNKKKAKPPKAPVLKSDEELASEAALVNGESFVLKLFQALHSSTLICPTCGERSSTFDPYLCVSLPLPQRCPRDVYVIVVSLDPHHFHEVKMMMTLNQSDGVKELREKVSADAKIPLKQLLLVQFKEDGFGATYSDEQPLSDILENDLVYAVETYPEDASIPSSIQEFGTPTSQLLVMHVEVPAGLARSHRFGSPTMLKVQRDITWKDLQKEILLKMEDSVCEEILAQTQKLSNLFMLRIYDGTSRKSYLPSDVDMPLYTQSAEGAYTTLTEDFGPSHIKIIAEWDSQTKKTVVVDDKEHIEIHASVADALSNRQGQGKVSLDECFKLYTQEEKLLGDDAWLCPHCKQQQQGTIKTLRLWSLPDVLVIHLKRFKQTGRSKLSTLVEFPIENLDMSAHLTHPSLKRDDHCYDLLGVSNHYGNMTGGHYTAYCRSPVDGEWREFNDTKVRTLDGPIATREAYLLFYQRRSLSKDVNQRLFTGDHWVFSLPLAPSEMVDASSVDEVLSTHVNHNQPMRRSRSRSASPSAHRQNNKDGAGANTHRIPSRPLTPQPFRRPVITYTDEKYFDDDDDDEDDSNLSSPHSPEKVNLPRRSRPIQRQASAPTSQFRREKSAGAPLSVKLKDPSRTLYNRRSLELDALDTNKKIVKSELSNGVTKTHSQSRSKSTDKPSTQVTKHESQKGYDLSVSTSKAISHQTSLSNNSSLESDAKYPSSSYDYTRYSENRKYVPIFEPTSMVHEKFDDKDGYSTQPSKSYDSTLMPGSDSENARKKLAQLIKQNSLNRVLSERTHVRGVDTFEGESNFVRNGSRIYDPQKSLDLARLKPLEFGYLNVVDVGQTTSGSHSLPLDGFVSDTRAARDIELKRDRFPSYSSKFSSRGTGYSLLEEPETYFVDLDSQRSQTPDFRSKLQDETRYQEFRRLAEKHFGGTDELDHGKANYRARFADDTEYQTSDYISPHLNGDVTRLIKYATISRTSDTSQLGRHERSIIPRSSTDHNIHYNNPSLAAPPSPTPPHSLREEQTFIHDSTVSTSLPSSSGDYLTSNRLTSREISAMQSYEFAGRNHHSMMMPSRIQTLPGYLQGTRDNKYNFRRPRGTWGIPAPKPAPRSLGNIPTPCLRESSV